MNKYPWPKHQLLWTNYISSLGGAWLLALGWHLPASAMALGLASLGAFLCSDWLNLLLGKPERGTTALPLSLPWQGFSLLALTLLASMALLWLLPESERAFWAQAFAAVACYITLILILRQEWVALDGRLVFLTHLLLTCPALFIGFLAWGGPSANAFRLWSFPASFFASVALFNLFWFEGNERPKHSNAWLALPLLTGILASIVWGLWWQGAFLALFLGRSLWLLRQRSRETLPPFASIRRLAIELQIWSAALLLAWLK